MTGICISLIHNNNQKRLAHIKPEIDKLAASLRENGHHVFTYEPDYRPEITPQPLVKFIKQQWQHHLLGRAWYKYRGLTPMPYNKEIIWFIKKTIAFNSPERRKASYRETVLSQNHILAWEWLLNTGADFLISFEDDTIFKQDSIEKINNLISAYEKYHRMKVYVDLAGGFNVFALHIHNLEIKKDNQFRHYKKPVTNTTCCYLISRPLARKFIDLINQDEEIKMIGSDWMINNLFMQLENNNHIFCAHADPTIFIHGSAAREYESLIHSEGRI